MYNNCFFENWYQQSRDWDLPLIVQFFDFVEGLKEDLPERKYKILFFPFFRIPTGSLQKSPVST